jgi:uncharacterized membrane protein YdjX (TVP38/TMEM64 family)
MNNHAEYCEPTPKSGPGRRLAVWVSILALLLTVALCLAVVYYWEEVRQVQSYGLLGILAINILAGGTMLIPVPGLLVTFTAGGVLPPALVGVASGLGEAIGAMAIYFTGYGGRAIVQGSKRPFVQKMVGWVERRGTVAVFAMSAVFNPFYYPVCIAIGALKYQAWKFFLATWAGKTVKGLVVSYLGYLGLGSVLRAFGIPV